MKISHCIGVSMCISISCYAQHKLDSLKDLLHIAEQKNQQESVDFALFQIAYLFSQSNQYDSAIFYYNKMYAHTNNKVYKASALNAIGVSYSKKGLTSQSISYYSQALALYEELKDTATVITISNNLAIYYKDKGLYENALDLCFDALPQLESQPPNRTLAALYTTIGIIYMRIQDYSKSYDYYQKSLRVRMNIGYEQGVGESYNNFGELFNETQEYDSALANLNKAIAVRLKIDDKRGLGRTKTLIAKSLTQLGKPKEAMGQLTEALNLSRTSNDLIGEILTLHEMSNTYTILKDFRKAEESLNNASKLISRSDTQDYLKRNLELQTELYRASGDKMKLIHALEKLMIVKDSAFNEDKVESLLALDVQYETEKKEQEIVLLQQQSKIDQAELEKSQLQNFGLIAFTGFLIAVAALGYRLYFVTQREKKTSEMYAQEMHHRTKNNLQMLSSFFTIQASMLDDDQKEQKLILDTQGRVKTMALVHSKLYRSTNASGLNLREYITDLVNSQIYTSGFNENKLRLDLNIVDSVVDLDKALRIGLIVNELITNAIKYAYHDQTEPLLRIFISKNDQSMVLEVTDNGLHPITTKDFEAGGSFGLRVIKLFVRELKGRIELRNHNGTSFLITIA